MKMEPITIDETTRLFADLGKPSLEALSYALRHPETWPKDFWWDYSDCRHCAMGLAHELWSDSVERAGSKSGPSVMAREFRMPFALSKRIFINANIIHRVLGIFPRLKSAVTPDMVADDIDAYLASRG